MRRVLKKICTFAALVLAAPCALTCRLEQAFSPHGEAVFTFWTHVFALFPGLPGLYLRKAFYSYTLKRCSLECHIGFGSLFTHRGAMVEDHVSLGNYNVIGTAHLQANTILASRVSITSGKHMHERLPDGTWSPLLRDKMATVRIGPNAWIGEAAVIMADVGPGCLIGAGSVVTTPIPAGATAVGNPAGVLVNR
ncbi:acyltransferase [Desulfonatronum thioautotrophicum]|uniref:acyltransferase n=1 Tax=Desulfonatronum thioautotrophicum TaxID=617001 RepID=UPI0005EB26C5|nr:acyltransferase [Desulfonatronum thioautotrophicum]